MIYWASKPGKIFVHIVSRALDEIIEWVSQSYCTDDNVLHISQELTDSLGGVSGVKSFAEKIREAHQDSRMLQISDYMYRFLYELFDSWIDIYNDMVGEHEDVVMEIDGVKIWRIDKDYIIDVLFWDLDFQFDPKTAKKLSGSLTAQVGGVSDSAINASIGHPVDAVDLKVEHMDHVEPWTKFTVEEDSEMITAEEPERQQTN